MDRVIALLDNALSLDEALTELLYGGIDCPTTNLVTVHGYCNPRQECTILYENIVSVAEAVLQQAHQQLHENMSNEACLPAGLVLTNLLIELVEKCKIRLEQLRTIGTETAASPSCKRSLWEQDWSECFQAAEPGTDSDQVMQFSYTICQTITVSVEQSSAPVDPNGLCNIADNMKCSEYRALSSAAGTSRPKPVIEEM